MSVTPELDAAAFTVMLAPSTLDNSLMLPRKVVPLTLAQKLERERDEARAEVTRLIAEVVNRNKRALDGDQAIHVANKLIDDNDALRAEVERLRGALEQLARLGNGDRYGNSTGNQIAIAALQEPTS